MESEIWSTFATLRISSAINGFAGLFAIWLAARFSSVMMDKGPTMLGKVVVSVFGVCVILMNAMFLMMAQSVFINTSKAFAAVRDAGTQISANAAQFVSTYDPTGEPALTNTPVIAIFLLSALLIILVPIWMPNNK